MENGYHEIYRDYEKEEFFNKVLEFIQSRYNVGKTDKRKNLLFSLPD